MRLLRVLFGTFAFFTSYFCLNKDAEYAKERKGRKVFYMGVIGLMLKKKTRCLPKHKREYYSKTDSLRGSKATKSSYIFSMF